MVQHGFGQVQLYAVVIDEEQAYLLPVGQGNLGAYGGSRNLFFSSFRGRIACSQVKGQADGEPAALSRMAVYPDVSVHQDNQPLGDGKSESEALLALCVLESGELLEHVLLLFHGDAAACVCHRKVEAGIPQLNVEGDAALPGKLEGV